MHSPYISLQYYNLHKGCMDTCYNTSEKYMPFYLFTEVIHSTSIVSVLFTLFDLLSLLPSSLFSSVSFLGLLLHYFSTFSLSLIICWLIIWMTTLMSLIVLDISSPFPRVFFDFFTLRYHIVTPTTANNIP